jgi:hypothetical protein
MGLDGDVTFGKAIEVVINVSSSEAKPSKISILKPVIFTRVRRL